jgi:hypothetical protein
MNDSDVIVLFDLSNDIKKTGQFSGSIITKTRAPKKEIIFSDSIIIDEQNGIFLEQALKVGFNGENDTRKSAFSTKLKKQNYSDLSLIEYVVKIPEDIMQQYDQGQFSDTFPFTISLLHTAGLFLDDYPQGINHLDFFKGEILRNPVSLILNGIIVADRVVIDHRGDPVFYDCLIVGRDDKGELNVSYEPLTNVDDKVVEYIIILGIEELKI